MLSIIRKAFVVLFVATSMVLSINAQDRKSDDTKVDVDGYCCMCGANSAGQDALFFARYANKVTMLVRSNLSKNMSQYLIDQIKNTPKIEVLQNTEIVEVHGDDKLEAITY